LLLGVEGEAKELFIDEAGAGMAFTPEDAADLARCTEVLAADRALVLRMGVNGAAYVREHFDRATISNKLWRALQELEAQERS
jgi:glycosyltransferase involved in cell wall biosynthesis